MIGFQPRDQDASSILDPEVSENIKSSIEQQDRNRTSLKLSRNIVNNTENKPDAGRGSQENLLIQSEG